MNRFRKTKKEKAREDVEASESSPAPFAGLFHKGKKEPEQKLELDLSAALPSTDDFRTSLLMPKLSARFSMLREQDDPNSILGKANDDSVLFPKRASRLNLFGHNPNMLSDIDEASDGSRPSFNLGRVESFASGEGYSTEDDRSQHESIMSRARRTEGNNLFGGRQKVYKIPSKSPSSASNAESAGGLGRAVYENDINQMSLFQKQKLKEKQAREALEAAAAAAAEETQPEAPAHESEDAFSSVSSTKRTTYSSTASGPTANTRISTAATSVDEQPLMAPSLQGLPHYHAEPPMHSSKPMMPGMAPERGSVKTRRLYGQGLAQSVQNQQASTLFRLESLSRQRAGTPELPMNRAYSRSATNLRDRLQRLAITEPSPVSSRPTSPPSSATSPKHPPGDSNSKPPNVGVPPLSPPVSENDDGTALMAALQPEDHGKATAMGLFNKPKTSYDENQFTRRQLQMYQGRNTPPLRQRSPPPARPAAPQDFGGRPRGLSNTSYLSRPGSAASSHYSEAHRPGSRSTAASVNASPARPGHIGTFFDNSSPSETEDEGYGLDSRGTRYSIDAEHPALRSATPSKPSTPTSEQQNQSPLPEVRYSDLHDLKPIAEHEINDASPTQGKMVPEKPDSPTLGPSGLGLSGLVRTHLRTNSDRSSIHPLPSPGLAPSHIESENAQDEGTQSTTIADAVSPPPLAINKPPSGPAWREELMHRHRRDGSTETQKEREEFAIELAERRKRVQEKLRDFAESESRAASPVSGRQTPDYGQPRPGNAFALLKNKSTKHNIFNRPEPKGIKGYRYENSSTPALVSEDPWRDDEERLPATYFGKHPNSSSPHIAGERSMRSKIGVFRRSSQDDSRESSRSRGASPHSSFQSRRDRSSSDASGRSKSRTRRDRDDLGTLEEDAVGSHDSFVTTDHDTRGMNSVASSARPSVDAPERPPFDRSSSAASGRFRYEASAWPPSSGYHDRPVHTPPAVNPSLIGAAPRPSPAAPPYSANATPPLQDMNAESTSGMTPAAYPSPAQPLPQRAPGHVGLHKRWIDKTRISEPTFVSSTSNVPTVGLPPGASLSNGMETPPLPPMNPRRRRQTTTQTILGALKGDKHDSQSGLSDPETTTTSEYNTFSDGSEKRPRPRQRLRKTSSEGGDLNAKARQQVMSGPTPAVPSYPPKVPLDGGMF